jgi:DNA sulfur modification protein DndB
MPDTVPALRGRLGDWEYYVTVMKLNKIAKEVDLAEKLHPHKELDLQIQREIGSRVEPMVSYLLTQKERFYGALIVAVYGGNPRFHPVKMAEHTLLDGEFPFGVIILDGAQRYFALDGQHRLASIKRAVEAKPELGEEEVSVILVPHMQTPVGMQRTRRLFNTINRYAKPTSQAVNITMDEDDAFALLTRRLLREYRMFNPEGRIKVKGASIPDSAVNAFTTLSVLYQVNSTLLESNERADRFAQPRFKHTRPTEEELEDWFEELVGIWNAIVASFKELRQVESGAQTPGFFRKTGKDQNVAEGHLLFRPIGQLAFAKGLRMAMNDGVTLELAVTRAAKIEWRLGKAPWKGLFWHSGQQTMITTKEAQSLGARIIAYLLGGQEQDTIGLRERYAAAIDEANAKLPPRVMD